MIALKVDRAKLEPFAVGASEVGAVLGCDRWTTPLALYRRKRGLDPARPDNLPMRIGRLLEPAVVALAREAIPLPIRRNRLTFAHHTLPLFATPDAFVGRDRLLEAKVVGYRGRAGWEDDDELPCSVRLQAQAQMIVTGREAVYAVGLLGTEVRTVLVEHDDAVASSIADAVTSFVVDHLDAGVPPDPLTFDERWAALVAAIVDAPALEVLAGEELQAAGDRILELRAEAKRRDDEVDTLRADILEAMGLAGTSRLTGNGWTATASTRAGATSWRDVAHALADDVEFDADQLAAIVDEHRTAPATTFVVREHRSRNND